MRLCYCFYLFFKEFFCEGNSSSEKLELPFLFYHIFSVLAIAKSLQIVEFKIKYLSFRGRFLEKNSI